MSSRAEQIGGFLANKESMIAGAVGLFLGFVFGILWAGPATAVFMIVGLAAGMIVGAFIHRSGTSNRTT